MEAEVGVMRLEDKLPDWVASSLISPEQAEAIREHERGSEARAAKPTRVPLVAEALGYLGGALAFAGASVALSRYWDDMATWIHLSLAAVAVVVTLAVGWLLRSNPEPAYSRFASAMWLVSAVALGWGISMAMIEVVDTEENVAMLVGLGVACYGIVLYALMRRGLQQAVVLAGIIMFVSDLIAIDRPEAGDGPYIGMALWAIGAIWLFLGLRQLLTPALLAQVLGAIVIIQGAQAMASDSGGLGDLGMIVGLVSSMVLVGLSVWKQENVLLAFGALGLFMFLVGTIERFFGDTLGAPLMLLLAGLILLAIAIVTMRLGRLPGSRHRTHGPPAMPA